VHDEVGDADCGVSADGVVELVDRAQTACQSGAGHDQPRELGRVASFFAARILEEVDLVANLTSALGCVDESGPGAVTGRDPRLGEPCGEPHADPLASGDRYRDTRTLDAAGEGASIPDRVEPPDVGAFRLAQQQVGQLDELAEPLAPLSS
jgi:hypothetical protein